MAQFAAVESAMAGFKLVGRKPVSFLVWLVVWLVLGLGPLLLTMAALFPQFVSFIHDVQSMGPDHKSEALNRLVALEVTLWSAAGPSFFWMMLVQTVLFCAMARAMLEPGKRAFAYLRVGMDEVRVLVAEILLVLLGMAFYSLLAGLGVLIVVFGRGLPHPWGGWAIALALLLVVAIGLYVPFKMSLTLPATFAEKHIRLFRSWGLTRGRFWPIVGMWLVSILLAIVLAVVANALVRAVVTGIAFGGGGMDQVLALVTKAKSGEGVDMAAELPRLLTALGPAMLIALILQSCIQVLSRIAVSAPFVSAYASLSGREED